ARAYPCLGENLVKLGCNDVTAQVFAEALLEMAARIDKGKRLVDLAIAGAIRGNCLILGGRRVVCRRSRVPAGFRPFGRSRAAPAERRSQVATPSTALRGIRSGLFALGVRRRVARGISHGRVGVVQYHCWSWVSGEDVESETSWGTGSEATSSSGAGSVDSTDSAAVVSSVSVETLSRLSSCMAWASSAVLSDAGSPEGRSRFAMASIACCVSRGGSSSR